ncbi:hypothetical protein D3C81_974070 [compost metagenome]
MGFTKEVEKISLEGTCRELFSEVNETNIEATKGLIRQWIVVYGIPLVHKNPSVILK